MDCHTVRNLLVPYLDGELAPAQAAWIEAHHEVCEPCCAATARLEAQSVQLSALPPPNMPGGLARDLFAQMDATLEAELDRMERAPAPAPVVAPPPPRFHRVSRVGLAAYATLLGAALAWGWWSHEVAADALVREQAMRMELERAERLRAMPVPLPQDTQQYRTVAHSRGRGHL